MPFLLPNRVKALKELELLLHKKRFDAKRISKEIV